MTIVSAPTLLVGSALTGPAAVVVEDGSVVDVLDHVPSTDHDHVRLPSGVLTAGMVDLQVNGFHGVDLAHATPIEWQVLRRAVARTGVTSFLPTLVTAPLEELAAALDTIGGLAARATVDGAALLGVHLEGPFLSPSYPGVHDPSFFVDPQESALDLLLEGDRSRVLTMVTLAPERSGAPQAIRRLTDAGVVVSIGHTDATAAIVAAAADAGATMVTHLFNAQRGIHHREPGVPGAALVDPRLALGIIVDLHHVAPEVVLLAFAAAPGRMVLVTDAVAATGLPPGASTLGGLAVTVDGAGSPPRRADGRLAGSTLTLDRAVRTAVEIGVTTTEALLAATRTPADVVRRGDLGRLEPGARADLTWWTDDLRVQGVWLAGTAVPLTAS